MADARHLRGRGDAAVPPELHKSPYSLPEMTVQSEGGELCTNVPLEGGQGGSSKGQAGRGALGCVSLGRSRGTGEDPAGVGQEGQRGTRQAQSWDRAGLRKGPYLGLPVNMQIKRDLHLWLPVDVDVGPRDPCVIRGLVRMEPRLAQSRSREADLETPGLRQAQPEGRGRAKAQL